MNKHKSTLEIAQKAMQEKKLTYPFPYCSPIFTQSYKAFLEAQGGDLLSLRFPLEQLEKQDLEYLVWQEWKEGFATLIENKIRQRLGIKENYQGEKHLFNRECFYAGGAKYIDYLVSLNLKLYSDIESLFWTMKSST